MDKLRTEHLYKKYGKRTVVNDVSIYLEQGEIVGLLGPNGAGKTTTFYMTTGLVTANSGKIFLNDLDITNMPMYQRAKMGIGYLPQEASVFRKMSVEDNIASVLELTDKPLEYQKEIIDNYCSFYCFFYFFTYLLQFKFSTCNNFLYRYNRSQRVFPYSLTTVLPT